MLEYASVVWSPFTQSNIDKIEMIQRKAARFVFNDYYTYSSVTNTFNRLKWAIVAQYVKLNTQFIWREFTK